MRITVEIPDHLAAQVQARGMSLETYVQGLIAEQSAPRQFEAVPVNSIANLEKFFEEMAAHSDKIPQLSEEAVTRESFYQDLN